MKNKVQTQSNIANLDDIMVDLGGPREPKGKPKLVSSPLLAAVQEAGTSHIYADTADTSELSNLSADETGDILREVHGNTVNQPLMQKVIERYFDAESPAVWADKLRERQENLEQHELMPLLYAIVCARIGNDMVQAFTHLHPWEVSLQLHMGLSDDPEAALQVGRYLHRMVPSGFVKVPFTPHAPHCLLVARDLEREGIPVNFTSTFSARQAVAAGLLANVSRTNIFMGRLNQGLHAALLGEHVCLETQRTLLDMRHQVGIKTQLIVASIREWQSFPRLAGCDVFTAPCPVLHAFRSQHDISPQAIHNQLDTSYLDQLGVAAEVLDKVTEAQIARLYHIEPECIAFLREFRDTDEYSQMDDGDQLCKRFEHEGWGDIFYAPSPSEWEELRRGKLPDLEAPLTQRLPLDTLYTLLAHADFVKSQEALDEAMAKRFRL